MDAVTPLEHRFLPAVANAVNEWFPELKGRSIAVSDIMVSKENTPTLPLALVALVRSTANPPARSHYEVFQLEDAFIIEFWLKPFRYKRDDGSETPFWTFYPYEGIRDTLLNNLLQWESPCGERIAYRSLTVMADPFAVVLTFGFVATRNWSMKVNRRGMPFEVYFGLCAPPGCVPDEDECVECEPDPCK